MARYTMKDTNGRYYIESVNGKLESDIKGHTYGEAIDRFAELENADVVPRSEVEKAKQEVAREIFEEAFDYPTLADWYISSVDDRDKPVWTDEHIEELLNDFYVIPKEKQNDYKVYNKR